MLGTFPLSPGAPMLAAALQRMDPLFRSLRAVVPRRDARAALPADWSVQRKRLHTPGELLLFQRLRAAFPTRVVLSRVPYSQLLDLRRSGGSRAVFRRYHYTVADFVICAEDSTPLVVVEVDARALRGGALSEATQERAALIRAGGLLYVRLGADPAPSEDQIRAVVRAALGARLQTTARGAASSRGVTAARPSPSRSP